MQIQVWTTSFSSNCRIDIVADKIHSKVVGPVKNPNCKFTFVQVVKLLILFPFFAVKNGHNFAKSILGQMFACRKDMFYRFLANADINWRPKSLAKLKLNN